VRASSSSAAILRIASHRVRIPMLFRLLADDLAPPYFDP
jgi:hypothetical protein